MSPEECVAARGLISLSRADLSRLAGVSMSAIQDFEAGQNTRPDTIRAITRGLEAGGLLIREDGSFDSAKLILARFKNLRTPTVQQRADAILATAVMAHVRR